MNIRVFKEKFEKASDKYDIEKFDKVTSMSIDGQGSINLVISMEEISELLYAHLSKKYDNYKLLEEIADVTICLEWIIKITKIDREELYKSTIKQYEYLIGSAGIINNERYITKELCLMIKEISKYIRGKSEKINIDILASCYVNMTQIKILNKITESETIKALNVKLDKIYNHETEKNRKG